MKGYHIMNNDTLDPDLVEIIKAFELLDPPKVIEYEYRLYYNEEGIIYRGTTLKTDPIEPGKYVIVDKTIFDRSAKYRIENEIPVLIPASQGYVEPGLIRSSNGIAVVKNNASLPLTADDEYENIEHYDYRSNRRS